MCGIGPLSEQVVVCVWTELMVECCCLLLVLFVFYLMPPTEAAVPACPHPLLLSSDAQVPSRPGPLRQAVLAAARPWGHHCGGRGDQSPWQPSLGLGSM